MGISGADRFRGRLSELVAEKKAAAGAAVTAGAAVVETAVKRELTTSSHTRKTPTPSQPGEPPSLVTGTLRRSISVRGPAEVAGGWVATIGPTAVYGRIQELGGEAGRGAVLPRRPYVTPAVGKSMPSLAVLFRNFWG